MELDIKEPSGLKSSPQTHFAEFFNVSVYLEARLGVIQNRFLVYPEESYGQSRRVMPKVIAHDSMSEQTNPRAINGFRVITLLR